MLHRPRSLFFALVVVFACLLNYCNSYTWIRPAVPALRLQATISKPCAAIGDVVVAEVDDIDGTVKDPKVFFKIVSSGKEKRAWMETKALEPRERLALQSGAVLKVKIASEDDNGSLRVILANSILEEATNNERSAEGRALYRPDDNKDGNSRFVPLSWHPATPSPSANRRRPASNKAAPAVPVEIPKLLLNNLKTGMRFEGEVLHTTPYAAFVSLGVSRKAKGGTYTEANAMLRKEDYSSASTPVGKGDKITVYVKEVFKQAGRFTVTMDPTIERKTIVSTIEQGRAAGKQRRLSRRLRLLLQDVLAGDSVEAVVDRVVPMGVLVTVTSLGPTAGGGMNVTALMSMRDLPEQFAVPPELAVSFQEQLLRADFPTGRKLRGCVVKVHPQPAIDQLYNMKVLFEEFVGPAPTDSLVIQDRFDGMNEGLVAKKLRRAGTVSSTGPISETDIDIDDEEDEDEDEEETDIIDEEELEANSDIQEIFDELRGDKAMVSFEDIKDWADIQDMIAANQLTMGSLEDCMKESTGNGKSSSMNLNQFHVFIEAVQDSLEAAAGSKRRSSGPSSTMSIAVIEDEDVDSDEEQVGEEELRQLFGELKGSGSGQMLTWGRFLQWDEVQEALAQKVLTQQQLLSMAVSCGINPGKDMDYDCFVSLVHAMDEAAMDREDAAEEVLSPTTALSSSSTHDSHDNEDDDYEELAIFDELRGKLPGISRSAIMQWEETRNLIDSELLSEKEIDRLLMIASDGKVTTAAPTKGQAAMPLLNREQFTSFLSALDEAAAKATESLPDIKSFEYSDSEDNKEAKKIGNSNSKVSVSFNEASDPAAESLMLKQAFVSLLSRSPIDSNLLPVSVLRSWFMIKARFEDGALNDDRWAAILKQALGKDKENAKKQLLNQDQFEKIYRLVAALQSPSPPVAADTNESDDDDNQDQEESAEEEQEEMSVEEMEEEDAEELFMSLKGNDDNSDLLSPIKLKEWEDLQLTIEDGLITQEEIDAAVDEILKVNNKASNKKTQAKGMTLDQFKQFINKVNEITEPRAESFGEEDNNDDNDNEDSEDEGEGELSEEELQSVYNKLRGDDTSKPLLSVKNLEKWDEIQNMIDNQELTQADFSIAVAAATGKRNAKELTFEQFQRFIQEINDMGQEEEEEEESDDQASSSSSSAAQDEDLEDLRYSFDQLRGASPSLSLAAIKEWDELKDFIKEGLVDQQTANELLSSYFPKTSNKKDKASGIGMSFEQFQAFVEALNDLSDRNNDDTSEEREPAESDYQELFDELRGDHEKVTLNQLMAFEELQELIDAGELDKATVEQIAASVIKGGNSSNNNKKGNKGKGFSKMLEMDLPQFVEVMRLITEAASPPSDDQDLTKEDFTDEEKSQQSDRPGSDMDLDMELNDDGEGDLDLEAELLEMFDELRGKNKLLPVKNLKDWPELQDGLKESGKSNKDLEDMIAIAAGRKGAKEFTLDQFKAFVDLMDEALGYDDDDMDLNENGEEEDGDMNGSTDNEEEEEEEEEMSEEERKAILDELFLSLLPAGNNNNNKKKKDKINSSKDRVPVGNLLAWDTLAGEIEAGIISQSDIDGLLTDLGFNRKSQLDREQFAAVMDAIDNKLETADDEDYGDEEDEEDYEDDDSESANVIDVDADIHTTNNKNKPAASAATNSKSPSFNARGIKPAAAALGPASATVKGFGRSSEEISDGIARAKTKREQSRSSSSSSDATTPNTKGKKGKGVQGAIDEATLELFDMLRGRYDELPLDSFRAWEELKEMLDEKVVKQSTIERALNKVGAVESGFLTLPQFAEVLDIISSNVKLNLDDVDEKEILDRFQQSQQDDINGMSNKGSGSGSGNKDSRKGNKGKGGKKAAAAAAEHFSEDDEDSSSNGQANNNNNNNNKKMKKDEEEEKEIAMFKALLSSSSNLYKEVEDYENNDIDGYNNSDDNDNSNYSDDGGEEGIEIDMEEASREIFNELAGSPQANSLALGDFLQWDELQELINAGALSRDDLASAIEAVGVDGGQPDAANLSFSQFFDLIQTIDASVDKEKLRESLVGLMHFDSQTQPAPGVDKVVFEKRLVVDREDTAAVAAAIEQVSEDGDKIFFTDSNGKQVNGKEQVLSAMVKQQQQDSNNKKNSRNKDSNSNKSKKSPNKRDEPDEEILEFFQELSRGRGYMTLEELSGWDELTSVLEGGLVDPKIVKRYLEATPKLPGNKIDLDGFAFFMRKLDAVLLDSGDDNDDETDGEESDDSSAEDETDPSSMSDENRRAISDFRDWLGKDIDAMEVEEQERMEQQFEELSRGKEYVTAKQLLNWDYLQGIVEELDDDKIRTMLEQESPNQKFDLDAFISLMDSLEEMLTQKELREMNEEEEGDDEDNDG